jgi:hypothetical protein
MMILFIKKKKEIGWKESASWFSTSVIFEESKAVTDPQPYYNYYCDDGKTITPHNIM